MRVVEDQYTEVLNKIRAVLRLNDSSVLCALLDEIVQSNPECYTRTDAVQFAITYPLSKVKAQELADAYHIIDPAADSIIQETITHLNEMRGYEFVGRRIYRPDGDWMLFLRTKQYIEELNSVLKCSPTDWDKAAGIVDVMVAENAIYGETILGAIQFLWNITQGELQSKLADLAGYMTGVSDDNAESLAQQVIDRYPPSLAEKYRCEDKVIWALQLALHCV